MREEKGDSPKNARIKIDYSKEKPKVTFSYPSKAHQMEGSMFSTIFIAWIFITFIIVSISGIGVDNYKKTNNITEEQVDEEFTYLSLKEEIKNLSPLEIIIILQMLIMPFLIYFPFRKFWRNVYPKYQAFGSKKKIAKLDKNDVRMSDEGYYCEIPVFNNIVLNYEATQDFSEYMDLFEIKEYKFKYYLKENIIKRLLKTKTGKEDLKKRQLNEHIWYARFYFSKRPKTGFLEVIYK